MLYHKISIVISLFLLGAATRCLASPQVITCPPFIKVNNTSTLSVAPTEDFALSAKTDYPFYVAKIALFDGPPHELAELRPVNDDDNPPLWQSLNTSKKDIFVSCSYADGLISLSKAIKNVNSCTLRQTEDNAELVCQ